MTYMYCRRSGYRIPPFHIVALLFLLVGCTNRGEPQLAAWENGTYHPVALSDYEINGQRDGATTRAVAILTIATGEQLRVELEIAYNPTPVMQSGRWSLDGPEGGAGEVRPESVTFLGGQGEGPSVGGRFRLDENGRARFRLFLPPRPVGQPNYRRD
jgi:hypothetical protein